jgi:NAD(P)-dependent dehydrogenase (short-subunit alcohol dehydrogenase family)
MSLNNKVAIVTGAKQGIGFGIAMALAKEGCKVVVSDLDQEGCDKAVKALEAEGATAFAVKCDVSKKADVDNLISETMAKFGQLDILVNNAGIFPFVPFAKMTEEDWDKVMNVNLKSIFLTSSSAIKVMKDGSKIVNISSIASLVAFEGLTHYCGSKGAVNAFVRALAVELAPRKINVNAVAPGAIATPGVTGVLDDNTRNQMMNTIPWKRWGEAEDIANAVVFLSSDKADYITGQTIVVDGGWTLK